MLASGGAIRGEAEVWAFEPKFDGWRVLVYCEAGALVVRTRSGRDVTAQIPELAPLAELVCDRQLVLDGELVARDGTSESFYAIGSRMMRPQSRTTRQTPVGAPLTFVAFDVLHDTADVTREPYSERRARLEALALNGPAWCTSTSFPGLGAELFAACHALGLEGLVAKRLDSRYRPGERSPHWIKAKTDAWRESHAEHRHEVR